MLVDQIRQGVDVADGLLGAHIAGSGLGAEEEEARRHGEVGIVHDAVVKHLDVQGIEHLPLVLVQALGLGIKDKAGIDVDVLPVLDQLLQALLVVLLHGGELVAEGGIIRIRKQVRQL